MGVIKIIHLMCVALSFTGFFIRGLWMIRDSANLHLRWVKIAPHIIDTLLLVSAIILAVQMRVSPLDHSWLMAKIVALLAYIGVGMLALKPGRSKQTRVTAWLFGLLIFSYIVSVAYSKSVTGWLALI